MTERNYVGDSLQLRVALRDFYDGYSACLDEGEFDRWPTFFTEDCVYQVIAQENHARGLPHATIWCEGRGMVVDRMQAIAKTTVHEPRSQRHFISALRVQSVTEQEIRSQANFAIVECLQDQAPAVIMAGRYLDVVVENGDTFLFKQRLCVFENHSIRTTLVLPV